MSAVEKLKALVAREQWHSHDATVLAGLALTLKESGLFQLLAVVEAAATLSNFLENEKETFDPGEESNAQGFAALETHEDYDREEQLGDILLAALVALDEALT